MLQFEISQGSLAKPRVEFFFLPERVIPDSYYSSESRTADFEIAAFNDGPDVLGRRGYRVHMDVDKRWIQHISDIIAENPQPRRAGERPLRRSADMLLDDEDDRLEDYEEAEEADDDTDDEIEAADRNTRTQ